ncbi:type VI secretion system contractile sheath large subunit, partial [Escherichia coli]|nr:type VI secretion system contractile sheath large subunit [Escherichia coli]
FLDQAIGATKQTEASRAEELIKTLAEEAMKGTVTWNKNLTVTFREAINLLDRQISDQLSEVMHHPELQKLEGSWRGLNYLVMNSETSSTL